MAALQARPILGAWGLTWREAMSYAWSRGNPVGWAACWDEPPSEWGSGVWASVSIQRPGRGLG